MFYDIQTLHSPEFKILFDTKVDFVQVDLTREAHVNKAFDTIEPWTYVINLAAETRLGLEPSVYKQKCKDLAVLVAKTAAAIRVSHFIEVKLKSYHSRIYCTLINLNDDEPLCQ